MVSGLSGGGCVCGNLGAFNPRPWESYAPDVRRKPVINLVIFIFGAIVASASLAVTLLLVRHATVDS